MKALTQNTPVYKVQEGGGVVVTTHKHKQVTKKTNKQKTMGAGLVSSSVLWPLPLISQSVLQQFGGGGVSCRLNVIGPRCGGASCASTWRLHRSERTTVGPPPV